MKQFRQTLVRSVACLAALSIFVGMEASANYSLTVVSLTGTSPTTNTSATATSTTLGSTTITLTGLNAGTLTGPTDVNVIDVGNMSTNTSGTADTGSFGFTEVFTLTGTSGAELGLSETVTLTGTFNLISGEMGAIQSSVTNTSISTGGSGFAVSYDGYAPPSPGTSGTAAADGNISLAITPASVPEPASVVMLGLGLIGFGGYTLRRKAAR